MGVFLLASAVRHRKPLFPRLAHRGDWAFNVIP